MIAAGLGDVEIKSSRSLQGGIRALAGLISKTAPEGAVEGLMPLQGPFRGRR